MLQPEYRCNGMEVNRTFACLSVLRFGRWIRFSSSVWLSPPNQCCSPNKKAKSKKR